MGKLEQSEEKMSFARVDAVTMDKLIKKDEEIPSKLTEKDEEQLKPVIEEVVNKEQFTVQFESMSESDQAITITQSEFMRRMKEMNRVGGGGGMMMGDMPEMYNLVINSNHPFIGKLLSEADENKQKEQAKTCSGFGLVVSKPLKRRGFGSICQAQHGDAIKSNKNEKKVNYYFGHASGDFYCRLFFHKGKL